MEPARGRRAHAGACELRLSRSKFHSRFLLVQLWGRIEIVAIPKFVFCFLGLGLSRHLSHTILRVVGDDMFFFGRVDLAAAY